MSNAGHSADVGVILNVWDKSGYEWSYSETMPKPLPMVDELEQVLKERSREVEVFEAER